MRSPLCTIYLYVSIVNYCCFFLNLSFYVGFLILSLWLWKHDDINRRIGVSTSETCIVMYVYLCQRRRQAKKLCRHRKTSSTSRPRSGPVKYKRIRYISADLRAIRGVSSNCFSNKNTKSSTALKRFYHNKSRPNRRRLCLPITRLQYNPK